MGVPAPKGARGAPRESPPQEGVSVPKGTRGAPRRESPFLMETGGLLKKSLLLQMSQKGSLKGVPAPKGAKGAPRESPLHEEPVGLQEGSLRS